MDRAAIGDLYAGKQKYVEELDPAEAAFQRLLVETVEWKLPHLMEVVPPDFAPTSVAEIGCFVGHVIGNLLINGRRSFLRAGFDVNADAIAVAKRLYPEVEFSP